MIGNAAVIQMIPSEVVMTGNAVVVQMIPSEVVVPMTGNAVVVQMTTSEVVVPQPQSPWRVRQPPCIHPEVGYENRT
jgi:hypothetical protein